VTADEAARGAVAYWLDKAEAALASARAELAAGRYDFAINRAYYAAFYAASAVLLTRGQHFVKHTGVRGAVRRDLVKSGALDVRWGQTFDRLFDTRQRADYVVLVTVKLDEARGRTAPATIARARSMPAARPAVTRQAAA
jgi:uncharacterized protein (UPF0332 family)